MKRWRIALVLLAAVGSSCAKFPPGSTSDTARVVFRLRVDGRLRRDYLYFVAFQISTSTNPDPSTGPLPVITYPAQNGYVAGKPTHYVLFSYDRNPVRPFSLFKFYLNVPGDYSSVDITKPIDIGAPINNSDYTPDGTQNEITFEVSLDQLTDGDINAAKNLKSLLVNFLTMNKYSTSTASGRVIDALGDTRNPLEINSPVRIPLTTSATYSNLTTNNLEPVGDVIDQNGSTVEPDVDIRDWSVEVRLP